MKYRTVTYFMLVLVVLVVIFWMVQYNRYHVLYYQEQMQLFRFDLFYLHSYLIKPGGIAGYIGAFLTQFCFYPWIGATIISFLLAGIYLLFDSICRENGKTGIFCVFLYIPVFLFLMALANQHFRLSYLVGFLIGLSGLRIYILFDKPYRYIFGFLLFGLIYIIAAGNALLFVAAVWIFEVFSNKKQQKLCIYLPALSIWAAILPYMAWRFVYTVPPREAFFALTPVDFLFKDFVNIAAWLSVPVLYVYWRLIAQKVQGWRLSVWKMIASCTVVSSFCIGSMVCVSDRRAEVITGMAFNVQNNHWDKAIQLGTSFPFSNSLISYFSNLAIAESGLLPYRMFYSDQTGPTGLFLMWQQSYFTFPNIGEAYYRLGLIQEAEHCAFEAMVSNSDNHNSQSLRRLVTTSIILRDIALFNKYVRLFDHTLFYRSWAKLQRQYMAAAVANPSYQIPGAPQPAMCDNFFINMNYGRPDVVLTKLLEKNPYHRLAFEYLMAWHLLHKDVESAKACMDTYYQHFAYPAIPVHYEEALMVYQNVNPSSNIMEQYPVGSATRERFTTYLQAYKLAQSNPQMLNNLYRQFGNTYWFYLHFKQIESLQASDDETDRY